MISRAYVTIIGQPGAGRTILMEAGSHTLVAKQGDAKDTGQQKATARAKRPIAIRRQA
jgi:ABC-type branched-subunit amino acid transport system ATPase component